MRTPTALVILALAATLSGCATPTPTVIPDPESTVKPIFASDEEALAAAEDAYAEYAAESDRFLSTPGSAPDALFELISDDLEATTISDLKLYEDSGWHAEGATVFDSATLQQHYETGDGTAAVVVY